MKKQKARSLGGTWRNTLPHESWFLAHSATMAGIHTCPAVGAGSSLELGLHKNSPAVAAPPKSRPRGVGHSLSSRPRTPLLGVPLTQAGAHSPKGRHGRCCGLGFALLLTPQYPQHCWLRLLFQAQYPKLETD